VLHAADEETRTQLMARTIAALDDEAAPAERRSLIRDLRDELEEDLAARTGSAKAARRRIQALVDDYRRLRAGSAPGPARTFRMSALAAEIRSLGRAAAHEPAQVRELFRASDGGRIAALVLLGAAPHASCLELVLDGIGTPRSAFEQFQALRTAEAMLPDLDAPAREALASALRTQMSEGPGHYINEDNRDRLAIATRLLERL
jgi:hypothetical protein